LRLRQDVRMVSPPPLPDLNVAEFAPEDLAELLVLQRCCWVQEAILNDTLDVPALHESAEDILAWASSWTVLCVRRGGRLVAAVRAREVDGVWELGRLMVAPDVSGRGIGRWLLQRAEDWRCRLERVKAAHTPQ
jgi:GNAT superfamily N-acetyltransferase